MPAGRQVRSAAGPRPVRHPRVRLVTRRWRADGAGTDAGAGGLDGTRIGSGGRSDFEGDERGIEDHAVERVSLREHMAEQLRLSMGDATDRLIGACLIAMLDPAGRIAGDLGQLAGNLGCGLERVEAVRARMMRFDPPGVFARDLRECLAVQLAEKNRLDPAMARRAPGSSVRP